MGWHSVSVLQVGRGQASTREAAEGRHIRVTGAAAMANRARTQPTGGLGTIARHGGQQRGNDGSASDALVRVAERGGLLAAPYPRRPERTLEKVLCTSSSSDPRSVYRRNALSSACVLLSSDVPAVVIPRAKRTDTGDMTTFPGSDAVTLRNRALPVAISGALQNFVHKS